MLYNNLVESKKPQRVVVVGASGFVGSAIVRALNAKGITVLELTRKNCDFLKSGAAEQFANLLRKDDAVVVTSAMAPCKDPLMLKGNIELATTIVSSIAKIEPRHVINISSDAVYADTSSLLTEASPIGADNFHGIMHLARELIFKSEIRGPLAMLRPSLLYGSTDPHNGYGPNKFRRLAQSNEIIRLFGNGEEQRDHVFIDDIGELVTLMLLQESEGVLNAATGVVHTFSKIANMVVDFSDSASAIETTERIGPMPHNGYRAFDASLCKSIFPHFCYTPIELGLKKSLEP